MINGILDDLETAQLKSDYVSGKGRDWLANKYGISVSGVYKHLKGFQKIQRFALTPQQMIDVLSMTEETHAELGRRFKVSHETIKKIRKRGHDQ
jgi:DNA-binding CsgD family transcriptional regulator